MYLRRTVQYSSIFDFFPYNLPMEKGFALHLNKLNPKSYPNDLAVTFTPIC